VLRLRERLAVDERGTAARRVEPRIMRIVVDSPAPFGPRNPVTVPDSTVNDRSSTALVLP